MIKFFIDHKIIHRNVVQYTLDELIRYIDVKYKIVYKLDEANVVYAYDNISTSNQLYLKASSQFWNNFKEQRSLPNIPLYKDSNDLLYIYQDDLISSTFFMLSGYEEYINLRRDKYNRFLFEYSEYKNEGIYSNLLVEEYRNKLISNLNSIGIYCKRLNIWDNHKFGLFLSHDVDGVYKYRSLLKSIAKIILKPSKFSLKELFHSKLDAKKDPYFQGFEYLIESSKKYNFKSTFFFITKVREKLDDFYNINDKCVKEVINTIALNGFEIGIHGSLQSHNNLDCLKEEKEILFNCYGTRQHYLKYDINITPKNHGELFKYDSTLGFADMIGFRRGTCMPFGLYDLASDTKLDLIEIPLLVMEQTLKSYMNLDPKEAYEKIIEIIQKVEEHNGLFTILWHPGNCSDEWEIWINGCYEKLLIYLYDNKVLSLTGNEILTKVPIK